jgi:hypothetical protein
VLDAADQVTRRKVSSLLHRGVLDRVDARRTASRATDFSVEVELRQVDGKDRVWLPSERKELKALVNLLDENLFASPLTGDQFEASGKPRWTG